MAKFAHEDPAVAVWCTALDHTVIDAPWLLLDLLGLGGIGLAVLGLHGLHLLHGLHGKLGLDGLHSLHGLHAVLGVCILLGLHGGHLGAGALHGLHLGQHGGHGLHDLHGLHGTLHGSSAGRGGTDSWLATGAMPLVKGCSIKCKLQPRYVQSWLVCTANGDNADAMPKTGKTRMGYEHGMPQWDILNVAMHRLLYWKKHAWVNGKMIRMMIPRFAAAMQAWPCGAAYSD